MFFLSYASEDDAIARDIAARLRSNRMEVHIWKDLRGEDVIRKIEGPISESDGFVALLSKNYLASFWCRKEFNIAVHRERDLQERHPGASYIRIFKVGDILPGEGGFARTYDILDCTMASSMEASIRALLDNPPTNPSTLPTEEVPDLPTFRNRDEEIDRVRWGLNTSGGQAFWLIVSPSQLGKSWFLDQLATKVLEEKGTWRTRLVDVRQFAEPNRQEADLILARLFDTTPEIVQRPDAVTAITRKLLRARRPHLCLLDSAELLNGSTANRLRTIVGAVNDSLQEEDRRGVRLGFVVASRRDVEWRGLLPRPRLSEQALTEFKSEVIKGALRDIAEHMGRRSFRPAEFERDAHRVHRFTEGLPALLVQCLKWIKDDQWLELHKLDSDQVFDELARPYVEGTLLSRDSLFPRTDAQDEYKHEVLRMTFRGLAPYRLFTASHLNHQFEQDSEFKESLDRARWSMDDLWRAVGRTALLSQPLDEPWRAIHGAIRRLLYRHFYRSYSERLEAHQQARDHMQMWTEEEQGTERSSAFIESIWHEAAALNIERPAGAEARLLRAAGELVQGFRPTHAYSLAVLRETTGRRLEKDVEIAESLSFSPDLFSRLVNHVKG